MDLHPAVTDMKYEQWMCCINGSTYTPCTRRTHILRSSASYFLLHTETPHHHHQYHHATRKFTLWFQMLLYIHFLQQTSSHFQTSFHFNRLFTQTKGVITRKVHKNIKISCFRNTQQKILSLQQPSTYKELKIKPTNFF